jgi:hypothetical protein
LFALTGLNVDRAYPELGSQAADRRRSMAMTLLLSAITEAQAVGADGLVFVGGLLDDRCASPQSVASLVQVLDAYPGQVLIASGANDPYDPEGIYGATNWGARTFVWSTGEFADAPKPLGAAVRGRADQAGWPAVFPAAPNGGPCVLVGADLSPEHCASWRQEHCTRHVITSGMSELRLDGVTVLAPVNPVLGEPWGRAALMSYDNTGVIGVEYVSLTTQPPAETIEIDVAGLPTTQALTDELDQVIEAAPEWSMVRLVGDLPQGVQLPSTSGYASPRGEVALDTDSVGFTFTAPERADHTALAEFVRSVIDADADARIRHQAIALGMAALVPASDGEDGP